METIILAAGSSTRLGEPKQLRKIQGRSMLRIVTENALALGLPVTVVLGAYAEEVEYILADLNVNLVINENWASGMASSLREGLVNTSKETDAVLFLLGDQPFITISYLKSLVAAWHSKKATIVASGFNDIVSVPVLIGSTFFDYLYQLSGDQGARQLIRTHLDQTIILDCPMAAIDFDTEEDFNLNEYLETIEFMHK